MPPNMVKVKFTNSSTKQDKYKENHLGTPESKYQTMKDYKILKAGREKTNYPEGNNNTNYH